MGSRLSIHQLKPNSATVPVVEAGARVVKLVSDFGLAHDINSGRVAARPDVVVIGRSVSAFNGHDQRNENPEDAAVKFVISQKEIYRLNPLIKIWEGHNEYNPAVVADMEWYGRMEAARVVLMMQLGLRCVVGNFSTGVPDIGPTPDRLAWWQAFLPACRAARDSGGYLGIHAYSSGNLTQDPSNILRHEDIHNLILVPAGLSDLPIIHTEFGMLDYRLKVSGEEYANQLIAIDGRLRSTPYVLGSCIFTFGSDNTAWDNFNVEGDWPLIDRLTAHIRAVESEPDPTPPPVIPPVVPPTPVPPTSIKTGDRVKVVRAPLKARQAPGLSTQTQRIMPVESTATVVSDPVVVDGIAWPGLVYDTRPVEYSSANYLQVIDAPVPPVIPPVQPPAIVYSNDWTHGQAAIPGHDNIRVPLDADGSRFEIEYLDGTNEPILPDSDPSSWPSIWLAPESTMRSGDTALYPFTERLPDDELALYLALDAPIVEHWFKRYGKQWWKLTKSTDKPAGFYRFTVEVYPDIYSGNHEWAPDPISGEVRCIALNHIAPPFSVGGFGQWRQQGRIIEHPGGALKHGIEFRARYGVETVGLFIRRWKVERV